MEEEEDVYEVEKIVDHKKFKTGIKYRVRWKGYTEDDDTWEWANNVGVNCSELIEEYWTSKGGRPGTKGTKRGQDKSKVAESKKPEEEKPEEEIPVPPRSPTPVPEETKVKESEEKEEKPIPDPIPRSNEKIEIDSVIGITKKDNTLYYVGHTKKGEVVWISSERVKRERPDLVIDFLLPRFELHYAVQERERTDVKK